MPLHEPLTQTLLCNVQSGSKVIGAGATKYLYIDSGTSGAEIIGIIIKGVVGYDWTLDVYVPAADAATATQAEDKRDTIAYANTDTEGGLLRGFAMPFDCYLDFTNDSAGDQTITQVTVLYRSSSVVTATWET